MVIRFFEKTLSLAFSIVLAPFRIIFKTFTSIISILLSVTIAILILGLIISVFGYYIFEPSVANAFIDDMAMNLNIDPNSWILDVVKNTLSSISNTIGLLAEIVVETYKSKSGRIYDIVSNIVF